MKLFIAPVVIVLCTSCKFQVKSSTDDKDGAVITASLKETSSPKIRNNITVNANDVKLEQAFLVYEDGKLVPESNVTDVDKAIKLRLIVEEGWTQENGMVSIGASERIETSDGQVLLDEHDLFKDYSSVSAQDAKVIALTAVISQLDKLYDYFLVKFRVWDKRGTGEITGSYKFYIK